MVKLILYPVLVLFPMMGYNGNEIREEVVSSRPQAANVVRMGSGSFLPPSVTVTGGIHGRGKNSGGVNYTDADTAGLTGEIAFAGENFSCTITMA